LRAAWRARGGNVGHKTSDPPNTPDTENPLSYAGYRFPPDVISYAAWLYHRFPLSLRMVEQLLAARGIQLTYETVRRWSVKFGLRSPGAGSRKFVGHGLERDDPVGRALLAFIETPCRRALPQYKVRRLDERSREVRVAVAGVAFAFLPAVAFRTLSTQRQYELNCPRRQTVSPFRSPA
jgi:hypothetical protein